MKNCTAALALVCLFFPSASSAQHRFEADEPSRARGIAAYSVDRVGKVVTVVTEDAEGTVNGRYVLEFDTPLGIAVRFDDLGTSLEMYWNPMNADFLLTDLKSGAKASARPTVTDDGKPSFLKVDTEGLLVRHEKGTSRAFLVLHETMINLGLYSRGEAKPRSDLELPAQPEPPPESPEPGDSLLVNLCPPSCTGSLLHSDFFVNLEASLCCENAYFYLQGKCSNNFCFGCCRTLPCDVFCILGDGFGCACSHRGRSCGPPLETSCGADWPPACT